MPKRTNHELVMEKLISIHASLPLMKDKIQRLEDSHSAQEAMIQEIHAKIHDADTGLAGDIREIKVWKKRINGIIATIGTVVTAVATWAIKSIIKGE